MVKSGRVILLGLAALFVSQQSARATYSIAGANTANRQIGGAATSCLLQGGSVYIVYGPVPGHGVVHAQATFNGTAKSRAMTRLSQNVSPTSIISEITSPSFDPNASIRQYGIVDLLGRRAAFTGSRDMQVALHHTNAFGSYVYS